MNLFCCNCEGKKKRKTAWQLFKLIFSLVREDKAALLVIPVTLKGGLLNGFVFGQYTRAWVGCSIGW